MTPPDRPAPQDPQYTVSVSTRAPGVAVARIGGELDYVVTPQLRRELFALMDGELTVLVLDLAAVRLLSAAALEMLLALQVMGAAQGCELRVVADSRPVLRPLALTGLDRQLSIFASVPAALDAH